MVKRCEWVTDDQLYMDYHDKEWGRPKYDDQELFEMVCLEGQQAGLSWITILKKRENYREAFDHFDPYKIIEYDDTKVDELMNNQGIIRNKLKVQSVIKNAQAYVHIMEETGKSFSEYLWDFVGGKPVNNEITSPDQIPSKTETSEYMSKQMKKDGFSFVGPTVCYALMQSVGMVNDHLVDCHVYEEIAEKN